MKVEAFFFIAEAVFFTLNVMLDFLVSTNSLNAWDL